VKDKIHPEYHEITVVMTDGSSFQTRSTWGQPGGSLRLDIDPKTHPAWTGVQRIADKGGRVSRFKDRFSGLNLGTVTANVAAKGGDVATAVNKENRPPKAAKK